MEEAVAAPNPAGKLKFRLPEGRKSLLRSPRAPHHPRQQERGVVILGKGITGVGVAAIDPPGRRKKKIVARVQVSVSQ
jgi:hypothetical protein